MTMIQPELIKREYGFLGDEIHVNACSVGVPPMRTQQALGTLMQHYMPMVMDSGSVGFEWLRSKVRAQIASLIGAQSARDIAFTKNTTEGTAALAWGYPLGAGDNVVVADLENPSNLYPWVHAGRQKGFEVRVIATDGRGVTLKQYLDKIDEHTRVVAVSAVQAGSGARVDLPALGRYCRERGIVLSVDAIQGLGRLVIDVEECCVDYLTCGGFKALGAGFGIGFIYCRSALAPSVQPMIAGDGCTVDELYAPEVYRPGAELRFSEEAADRFGGGSSNTTGIWLLHHSLSLQEEAGRENIEKHVLSLERYLRAQLKDCPLDVLPSGDLPSGMVLAWYPKERYQQAEAILQAHHIHMTHHEGYLRMSLAMHNNEQQMDVIASALRQIGALGA